MAATTKLIQRRPVYRPSTTVPTSIHLFSSSSDTPNPNENSPQTDPTSPPPQSQSPISSYLSGIKASLRQQQGNPQAQPRRLPFSFSSSSPASGATRSPPRISNIEEISKNLSEYRHRTAVPTPSPPGSPPQHQSPHPVSLEGLYQRNLASRGEVSSSAGSNSVRKLPFDAIKETLTSKRVWRLNDTMSASKYKGSLKLKPGDRSERDSPILIGGSDNLPSSIFGREMRLKEGDGSDAATTRDFMRIYSPKELGEKLRSLRPEKKRDWFSLQELNERLMKLREIDEKEDKSNDRGLIGGLRVSLEILKATHNADEKKKKNAAEVGILGRIGKTPAYMFLPPKDHLVEQYFHPDNMSASEKLKLELKKVRDEFKMSESDCGSARVQVAQLTTKIKHLSTVLHKKDKHSKKGLQGMVQKRKKLLKYLRRTDWESYCFVLLKLGLRDNPDYKN